MKKLLPIAIALLSLLAIVSALNAQSKVFNPNLEKGLVFQWKIVSNEVHYGWNNQDFTIRRSAEGLVIYYGAYESMGAAMAAMPSLPENSNVKSVSLVPFFNQVSITAADAFALMGNRNWYDLTGQQMEEAVSFTVYFDTFISPKSKYALPEIKEPLSFEIMSNHVFAYSAGEFDTLEEANAYKDELKSYGYDYAEVNRFLNGQKVALHELEEIFAYVQMEF